MLALKGALGEVIEASREAVTLAELARDTLGGLQRALDCSLGSFTYSPADGAIAILNATDSRILKEYRDDWFDGDPINAALGRYDPSWIIPASRLPEWNTMRRHPLYAEWAPSKNVRFLLHLRLSEARYLRAGATNVFLCRSKNDFGHREFLALAQVLPDLETAVTRCHRVAAMSALGPFLESLLDSAEGRARLALRADGQVVWASKAAQRMLAGHLGRGRSLPDTLIGKARELVLGRNETAEVRFAGSGGIPVTATLQAARTAGGEVFAVIGLQSSSGALAEEFRERFGLTAAEADVLFDLSEGLSNAEIAERRSVSITTVRTHVAHILSKLNVHSRLQAGLLARAAT
jgi:DNA-binding CsgD family transcriptional regulator